MKKILFTPIGMTDPITHLKDGSMLHICRVYKPDKVIMYMSAEVLALHEKDNRYIYCLEKLMQLNGTEMEIECITRPLLKDVQEYDVFYEDFQNIIRTILQELGDEDELLLNVSSGTPAMKSALLILSVLFEHRLHPIQVSTPIKKSNSRLEDKENYDVELNWELNEDNVVDFENRTSEPKTRNFTVLLIKDNIRKLVASYDYTAALELAKEIKNNVSENEFKLLELACERVKLNKNAVDRLLAKLPYDIIPIKSGNQRTIFEYALSIDIKCKKEEYADFVRALTPITTDLVEIILYKQCNIDINSYCKVNAKGVRKFDGKKLEGTDVFRVLNKEFCGAFKADLVGTRQMVPLILEYSSDTKLKVELSKMVDVEQKVRNMTAHEIVSVTPEWIKAKSGMSVEQILDLIKYLLVRAGINATKEHWESYETMNEFIYSEL